MPITPRGNTFMVSVGSGKDRVRKAAKTYAEAQELEQRLLQEAEQARLQALQAAQRGDTTKTLQDALDLALNAPKNPWKGSKGERTTLLNARQMIDLLGGVDTPVPEITAEAIEDVVEKLEAKGNTGATINRKLAALSRMLKLAEGRGWIKSSPRIERHGEQEGRIYWFNEEEETAMKAACRKLGMHDLADYIHFAISTGFRRSEMLRLRVADCHGGVLRLHQGETKSGYGRSQPIRDPLIAAMVERAREAGQDRVFFALNEYSLRVQWGILRDFLGQKDNPQYVVHSLRHTTATRLAIKGVDTARIKAFMGHEAVVTTMRYIHLAAEHLNDVADILLRPGAAPSPAPEAPETPAKGHLRRVA